MQCNKLAVQYVEFLVTWHTGTGCAIFMPLLSMINFFLSEALYLTVCQSGGGVDSPQFPSQLLIT